MSVQGQTALAALVTGGASGIGRAIVEMLVLQGTKVYILDRDLPAAQALANDLNSRSASQPLARAVKVDVASWESLRDAFESIVAEVGRLDYVFPIAGIGERTWIPNDPTSPTFAKPDLTVLDIDLYGVLYTISLAIQQFRRQGKDDEGFRGKIGCVASVCGFYCVPTLPIYTAAKHAVVGFVRSYGKHLVEEGITVNAVCPNVVRTNISTGAFYDDLESRGLLTPMKGVVQAMESFLTSGVSGEVLEVGPNGGFVNRAPPEHLDEESSTVCKDLHRRGLRLQQPTVN